MKHQIFVLIALFWLFFISTLSFAQGDKEEDKKAAEVANTIAKATETKVRKISAGAISSLAAQLSEEKFGVLKGKLLNVEYAETPLNTALEELHGLDFSEEEITTVRNSLRLYYDMLEKINQVAPLIYAANETKKEIAKLEKNLETLLKDEQGKVVEEIKALKVQLQTTQQSFQVIAQQFDFDALNFDRLPGMLTDLGYEDSFYDVIYAELSAYLAANRKVKTSESIVKSLDEVLQKIKDLENKQKEAETDEQKQAMGKQLQELAERKNTLLHDFTLNATGIDTSTLEKQKTEKVDWREELNQIFSPIVVGLTALTEPSRRLELLRSNVASYEQHLPKIRTGLTQLQTLIDKSTQRNVKQRLEKEQEYWQQQEKELITKLEVAKQQLIELQEKKVSITEAFISFKDAVFSKRGLNILSAIGLFFATFIGLFLLRRLVMLVNPLTYIPRFRFISNLIDVFLYTLTFTIAVLVLMFSLYVAGEILVLGVVAIMLLGMIWALRSAIPKYFEQIKLMVGIGPVRQGEKVIYNGIGWRVDSIGIYCYLRNPALTPGELRLPIKDLIDMRSRPYDEDEKWFPSQEGDYVLIDGKNYRQIVKQTPENIIVKVMGGEVIMPTKSYLSSDISNLSAAPFYHGTSLFIAYEHRYELLEQIVDQLREHVDNGIKASPFGESALYVFVEFASFTDKSLEIWAWLQSKSEVAGRYVGIKLTLEKLCLEAANKYGWQILRFNPISHHHLEEKSVASTFNTMASPHSTTSKLNAMPDGESEPDGEDDVDVEG